MSRMTIYTKNWCPYCLKAKQLLTARGFDFVEIDITDDLATELAIIKRTGQTTVPQILIDERSIGGFTELDRLISSGYLNYLNHVA